MNGCPNVWKKRSPLSVGKLSTSTNGLAETNWLLVCRGVIWYWQTMKILLAEDSGFMRIAMERVLSRAGHNVTPVEDGQRAICVARESIPDLVLLDMMLPR